jgi:glycosyltransferase involved in cell wall biosynthesis
LQRIAPERVDRDGRVVSIRPDESPVALRVSVLVPVFNERHVIEPSLRRLLGVRHDLIAELEVIVVDDGSTDGSGAIVKKLAAEDRRVKLVTHAANRGKGAAIRTGVPHATGEVTIIYDADLELDSNDIPALLVPFVREGADAVLGSRYLHADYRRAVRHRHSMVNGFLTSLGSWLTDISFTDVETGYKAIRTPLLKSIPLGSDDFRIEVELVFKLAARHAHVFEVPVRYLPRTYDQGKKIRPRDGFLALAAMLRYSHADDIFQSDPEASRRLVELEQARHLKSWLGETLRPFVGDRVLEIGAGIGTLSNLLIPRELYVASDVNPDYLDTLRSFALGKPYVDVREIDVANREHFRGFEEQFDTALCIHVLDRLDDPAAALANLRLALRPAGRLVVMAPRAPDAGRSLEEMLQRAGFNIEQCFDFNRAGRWLTGGTTLSRLGLKLFDAAVPALRRLDRFAPWGGASSIAVGRRS